MPSVGLTLRMVEAKSARIVWAGMRFRSGDDNETVFGWGRIRSAERLAEEAVAELLKEFHEVGRETGGGGQPGSPQQSGGDSK